MGSGRRRGEGTLRFDLADQIDRACDRAEADRVAGRSARLEDYLIGVDEPGHPALLRELLASELEWRRHRGERPEPREYRARFPGHSSLIDGVFDESGRTSNHFADGPGTVAGAKADREAAPPTSRGSGPEEVVLRPGSEPLAGFRLVALLGRGGFGEVWRTEAPGGVPVALKFVRLQGRQAAEELRALETIKGIRHPNLLALFGAWRVGELLILGMELGDGTLMDRLERARAQGLRGIPAGELIEYIQEAAKGIDYLNECIHTLDGHERVGVQHRDIKPQNILLVGRGVKVADFGLARLLEKSATGHTGCMTPSFAPPEFFGNRTSNRSDQYSLAVSYCLLRGGRLPFPGRIEAVISGHLSRPPDLSMLPKSERPATARALAKDPTDRWPSCRAFVAALEAALDPHTPPSLVPVSGEATGTGPNPAASTSFSAEPVSARPEAAARPPRGGRTARRVVALMLLLTPPTLWGLAGFPWPFAPPTSDPPARFGPPSGKSSGQGGDELLKEIDSDPGVEAPGGPPKSATHVEDGNALYVRGMSEQDGGNVDVAHGHFLGAIAAYTEAIRIHATSPAYNSRGNAYYQLQEYDRAIADYTAATVLDPSHATSYYNLGTAHAAKARGERSQGRLTSAREQLDLAIRALDDALLLDPGDENSLTNREIARQELAALNRSGE